MTALKADSQSFDTRSFLFFAKTVMIPACKVQISFGKGKNSFWMNVSPSHLFNDLSGKMKRWEGSLSRSSI